MHKAHLNQSVTHTFMATNSILVILVISLTPLLLGCSSTKLSESESTSNPTQPIFNITSKKVDANIGGVKYFGFYIFNLINDLTSKPVNTADEQATNSYHATRIAQTLSRNLGYLMGMDISNPDSDLSQLIQIRREASNKYETDLNNYLRKNNTTPMTTLIGERSLGDLIDAHLIHPKEKDLQAAQAHLNLERYAQNNIDDLYNLLFAGIAQINVATSTAIDPNNAYGLAISPPILAQATAQNVSYLKDYAKAINESIDNTSTGKINYDFYAAQTSQISITTSDGELMHCGIYNWGAKRKVGSCVNKNGDTYIISSHIK